MSLNKIIENAPFQTDGESFPIMYVVCKAEVCKHLCFVKRGAYGAIKRLVHSKVILKVKLISLYKRQLKSCRLPSDMKWTKSSL